MTTIYSNSVLLVGNWHWDIYEEALAHGFQANGWDVIPFNTHSNVQKHCFTEMQMRLRYGPIIDRINRKLLRKFKYFSPSVVFINRSDMIYAETLREMKRMNKEVVLLLYHNDNPYIHVIKRLSMRHFFACIPVADVTLVYRPENIKHVKRFGATKTAIFMPYYISYRHTPNTSDTSKCCDVVYVGHYENDGRGEIVDYLIRHGIKIKIYGYGWQYAQKKFGWRDGISVKNLWGKDYVRCISSAKIGLVFLSSINQDVYSRRCFEITACGTLMIAPYTKELAYLFSDGEEAALFTSREDLLKKIEYYLINDTMRVKVSQKGMQRCRNNGNDEVARIAQLINSMQEW